MSTASETVWVRKPTAAPAGEVSAPSFLLDRPVAGLTIGIRADRAWRSWQLISEMWAENLRRDGAETIAVETGAQMGRPGSDDRKQIEELAGVTDCAVVGLGTCGSCTTFTIKDAVVVEDRAKPVVAVVCDEFAVHARNVATHLGHRDLKILVLPYPLEARPAEELRAIAGEFYPKLLELIGAHGVPLVGDTA
jgi:hypothetical protein